jgi:hypothetical protein
MPGPLTLRIEWRNLPTEGLLKVFRQEELPQLRRRLARAAASQLLARIAELTPVDTGRAQESWRTAQNQLEPALTPPASSNDVQVTEGTLGSLTLITIVNRVPYMLWLEQGTRTMSPFAMIQRALLEKR